MAQYEVEAGDTLWGIAQRSGLTIQQILDLNPDLRSNPSLISVGANIRLGAGVDIDGPVEGFGGKNQDNSTSLGEPADVPPVELDLNGQPVEDPRAEISHDRGRITFGQIARSLGMSRSDLANLNPHLLATYGEQGPTGNVWGMDINTGNGNFWGKAGNVAPRFREGLANARVPWEQASENRADQAGEDTLNDIMSDPAYLALLRAFDLQEAQIQSSTTAQQERLAQALARNQPMYDTQIRHGTRSITNDFGGRGMFFGSGRLRDTSELEAQVNRNRSLEQSNVADQQAQLETSAAERIADLRRRRAEEQLAASERRTQSRVEGTYSPEALI